MGRGNIEAAFPSGKFDRSLLISGGNQQMYEFMGENIYLPLYKMVQEKDVPKLQAAVSFCDEPEHASAEECIHIQNSKGGYDTFVLNICKCTDFDGYEIELHNVSDGIRQLEKLDRSLDMLKDYATISGGILFYYCPSNGHFRLFWQNYEQRIDLADMPLDEWEKKVIREGQVTGKDLVIFENFCNSVRSTEYEQTYSLQGSFLTWGKNTDSYRVKFIPRLYDGQKTVIGIWTIMNEKTGNVVEDFVEGNYLDSMTNVMNKKGITTYAEAAVESGEQLALIMLDIDNFKSINDTYGHLFGDTVIATVADVIKKVIGEHGVVGRVGGDEFLIIMDNYGDELGLRNYLRSIKVNINSLFLEKVGGNRLSCSIGVSRCPLNSDKFRELYVIADRALYLAKEKGKNCYIIYKEELHGKLRMTEEDSDLKEIREAFYSEKDMFQLNQRLADMVLRGKEVMPEVLEQLAVILSAQRVVVIWGEKEREIICAYPLSLIWTECREDFFESESFRKLFRDDMLVITNVHTLEYSMPEEFEVFRRNGSSSAMQHYLRNKEGTICGFVSVEVNQIRRFPKLAIQLFENMCKIINAVLLREDGER